MSNLWSWAVGTVATLALIAGVCCAVFLEPGSARDTLMALSWGAAGAMLALLARFAWERSARQRVLRAAQQAEAAAEQAAHEQARTKRIELISLIPSREIRLAELRERRAELELGLERAKGMSAHTYDGMISARQEERAADLSRFKIEFKQWEQVRKSRVSELTLVKAEIARVRQLGAEEWKAEQLAERLLG